MQNPLCSIRAALLVLTLIAAGIAGAAEELVISDLTDLDRDYMDHQRTSIDDIARRQIGQGFNGIADHDVALLQRLLDNGIVASDERQKLQGMGILLGDLFAAELGMDWVVYEDGAGRSRALRYRKTDNYLFPVTMISRRREVGDELPVAVIYASSVADIKAIQDPLPYQ